MKLRNFNAVLLLGCVPCLLIGCGSPSNLKLENPIEPLRELGGTFSRLAEDALSLKSIGLNTPLGEIRAEDESFVLTQTPSNVAPFYSNNRGPIQSRYLREDGWKKDYARTKPVRVFIEGQAEPLYGKLAIFPPANVKEHAYDRFNPRITLTQEAVAQMEKDGIGQSCLSPIYAGLVRLGAVDIEVTDS